MRKHLAIPRVLVWTALAAFTLYSGIRLATGPGRDIAFEDVTWTSAAIAQVLVLAGVIAGWFLLAAFRTFRVEIAAPPPGTVVVPGARLGLFGETVLTAVGGLLLLGAVFEALRIPEALLVGQVPQYASYFSASPTPDIVCALLIGVPGLALMVVRRYVWVFASGKAPRRYWARALGRGRAARAPLELYWTFYCVKRGVVRVPVAYWLRGRDPSSAGFFRDLDLAQVPMHHDVQTDQLRQIERAWQVRLAELTGVVPQVVPEHARRIAMVPQAV